MDNQYVFNQGSDNFPTSFLLGPNFLSSKMYQLSPPEDLTLGIMLVRPTGVYIDMKEVTLTKERYGLVHRVYIMCDQDNVIKEDLQKLMIEKNPPEDVKVITGADHMVMFSKPQELCSCLQGIAENYS